MQLLRDARAIEELWRIEQQPSASQDVHVCPHETDQETAKKNKLTCPYVH